jgi:hypothetical protein
VTEPIKASEVAGPEVDEDTRRRNRAVAAVNSRLARITALRSMGAVGPSSDDLAGKIDEGLAKRDKDIMADFRRENK